MLSAAEKLRKPAALVCVKLMLAECSQGLGVRRVELFTERGSDMPNKLTVILIVLAIAGCGTLNQPSEEQHGKVDLRHPILDRMHLVEGANVVDRAPSGLSVVALLSGTEITDWQVFDANGKVVFQQKADDGMGWWDACLLSDGEPSLAAGKITGVDCCWDNWGCLICDFDEENCTMDCETKECKDANGQALPPVHPEDPLGQPSVAASPDGLVIAVDPAEPGWTVLNAADIQMHLATRRSDGVCPICAWDGEGYVCWELPCLPAKTNADTRN